MREEYLVTSIAGAFASPLDSELAVTAYRDRPSSTQASFMLTREDIGAHP